MARGFPLPQQSAGLRHRHRDAKATPVAEDPRRGDMESEHFSRFEPAPIDSALSNSTKFTAIPAKIRPSSDASKLRTARLSAAHRL